MEIYVVLKKFDLSKTYSNVPMLPVIIAFFQEFHWTHFEAVSIV